MGFAVVNGVFYRYFFSISGLPAEISVESYDKIISKSGERIGEYDFFFEWFTEPTMEQVNDLMEKIDETLAPLHLYTFSIEVIFS